MPPSGRGRPRSQALRSRRAARTRAPPCRKCRCRPSRPWPRSCPRAQVRAQARSALPPASWAFHKTPCPDSAPSQGQHKLRSRRWRRTIAARGRRGSSYPHSFPGRCPPRSLYPKETSQCSAATATVTPSTAVFFTNNFSAPRIAARSQTLPTPVISCTKGESVNSPGTLRNSSAV